MKKILFSLKTDYKTEESQKYNFTEIERDKYISEISQQIFTDVRVNELKEVESYERAANFVTTR